MGRELKRVPMDFNWPARVRWPGYVNPHWVWRAQCPHCVGTALNPESRKISEAFYGTRWCNSITQDEVDALIDAGRLLDFTHRFVVGEGWQPIEPAPVITAEMVNEWNVTGIGHDGVNRGILIETRCKRLGIWGPCEHCDDGGIWASLEAKEAYESWERTDPPTGDGYQLWETTSEGSPVSPVFETLDALCEWCADNATTFGSMRASAEDWRCMLDEGFVRYESGNIVFM